MSRHWPNWKSFVYAEPESAPYEGHTRTHMFWKSALIWSALYLVLAYDLLDEECFTVCEIVVKSVQSGHTLKRTPA